MPSARQPVTHSGPRRSPNVATQPALCTNSLEFAQSAQGALQRITECDKDTSLILILSDINMPGMSGLDLLPKAKAARPGVPVIMITAYGDAETKRKALANGADAFLTKPIDFTIVRNEIDMRVGHAA